ncbi:hypothetical protein DYB37_010767 [Aphanomyces astaci]|uniref:Uncharacterized protein n=1 Tax=Aphanomyces astaci TaxID=112090 RepID=A0A3R6XZ53_APHAT|nr:hypothetical protein DYB37_010767 [Aphanomyces astaci]
MEAHAYCKKPKVAIKSPSRAPIPYETHILDSILNGSPALDQPPKFLKEILTPNEMALFSDQMRLQYGFLQIPLKIAMKLSNEMPSPYLARLFFPLNPQQNAVEMQACDTFRQDLLACYVHPHGRKLIIQFNSKSKAAHLCDRAIPFLSKPAVLRHYAHPDDPHAFAPTEDAQRNMTYSFRLLQVPMYIPAIAIWKMLTSSALNVLKMQEAASLT